MKKIMMTSRIRIRIHYAAPPCALCLDLQPDSDDEDSNQDQEEDSNQDQDQDQDQEAEGAEGASHYLAHHSPLATIPSHRPKIGFVRPLDSALVRLK
jgi:hypothetical protein